jgi:hypothetical protein
MQRTLHLLFNTFLGVNATLKQILPGIDKLIEQTSLKPLAVNSQVGIALKAQHIQMIGDANNKSSFYG